MTGWVVHHDMRAPEFGTPAQQLYSAALEMSQWADEHGASGITLSEHHGSRDGYLPAPLTMAAAVAARTTRVNITVSALILTLRDPIATAEEAMVVDLISGGRLLLILAGGYVADECAMFGIDFERRGEVFEEKLAAFVQALTGEEFEYQGRRITVTPRAVRHPRPPVLLGGFAPKRAARLADGYAPPTADLSLADTYRAESRRLGKGDGLLIWPGGPKWVFVTEDPDKAWAQIGPNVLHEANSYGEWAAAAAGGAPYAEIVDVEAVRKMGHYAVVTPEECIDLVRRQDPGSRLVFKPLVAGLDPDLGWASLRLFVDRVLPALK